MSEVRLDAGTRTALTQKHTAAAEGITGLADSVPTSVEGGLGTPELLDIVATVVGTADDIALVNEAVAKLVDGVGRDFEATDEGLAGRFERLEDEVP